MARLSKPKLRRIVVKNWLAVKLRYTKIEYQNNKIDCHDTKIVYHNIKIDCQNTKIGTHEVINIAYTTGDQVW